MAGSPRGSGQVSSINHQPCYHELTLFVKCYYSTTGVPLLARAEFGEALADPRGNARSARGRQRNGQLVIESKSP